MGDVLVELEDALRSKHSQDRITPREQHVLQACKVRAIQDFTFGAVASSAVAWIGSAVVAGMWRFNRSLNSCVDQILELEGSRMQRELAEIILSKHHNNASRLKLVKKYFYGEQVFNDTDPDKALFRWRYRSIYVDDNSAQSSVDVQDSSSQEQQPDTHTPSKMQFSNKTGRGDILTDPFDCIFGEGDDIREIAHPDDTGMSRRHLRGQKRAHRRHKARQHADTDADD